MSINSVEDPGDRTLQGKRFTKSTSFTFQSVIKPFSGICVVCKKGFTENLTERDPVMSRACTRESPVCSNCDNNFIQTTKLCMPPRSHFDDEPQSEGSSDECIVIHTEGEIDEQLTNTHISGEMHNKHKNDEWVFIKYDESDDELDSEKLFSIKLCNDERNEECMIIQTSEDAHESEISSFSHSVKDISSEEFMVMQSDDYTVSDIIGIGALSFNNAYEQTDDNVYEQTDDHVYEQTDDHVYEQTDDHVYEQTDDHVYEQTDDHVYEQTDDNVHVDSNDSFDGKNINQPVAIATTSKSSIENDTWSICTNKFRTGDSKLEDWRVCTKGFSIRGESSSVCQVCRKYFRSDSDLKFHMLSHSPEKSIPSVCRVPSKSQRSVDVLNASPTNSESYLCNVCNKTFSDNSALKVHAKLHSSSLPGSSGNIYFKKILPKSVPSKNAFFHVVDKQLSCSLCGARFQQKHQLIKHTKTHLMLTCKVCQRVFKSSAKLKKHMYHVCGEALPSSQSSREETVSESTNQLHSSKKNLPVHKTNSDKNDYVDVSDLSNQGKEKKIGKDSKGTKKTSSRERSSVKVDKNEKREGGKFVSGTMCAKGVIRNVKDEYFEYEDFPMVEDDYTLNTVPVKKRNAK